MTKIFVNTLDGNVYFILDDILYCCPILIDNTFNINSFSCATELKDYIEQFIISFLNDKSDNMFNTNNSLELDTDELEYYMRKDISCYYILD